MTIFNKNKNIDPIEAAQAEVDNALGLFSSAHATVTAAVATLDRVVAEAEAAANAQLNRATAAKAQRANHQATATALAQFVPQDHN